MYRFAKYRPSNFTEISQEPSLPTISGRFDSLNCESSNSSRLSSYVGMQTMIIPDTATMVFA